MSRAGLQRARSEIPRKCSRRLHRAGGRPVGANQPGTRPSQTANPSHQPAERNEKLVHVWPILGTDTPAKVGWHHTNIFRCHSYPLDDWLSRDREPLHGNRGFRSRATCPSALTAYSTSRGRWTSSRLCIIGPLKVQFIVAKPKPFHTRKRDGSRRQANFPCPKQILKTCLSTRLT